MKTEAVITFPNGTPKYEAGVIICDCGNSDHSLIYRKWKADKEWDPSDKDEVFLSFCLNTNRSLWRRIKTAWKYLFKKDVRGSHGEIIINKDNVSGLEDIVNFLKENNEINKS